MSPEHLLLHHDQGRLWSIEDRARLPVSQHEAYLRALAVRQLRLARGEVPRGYKIGFTNCSIWPLYQVFAPIWGTRWAGWLAFCEGEGELTLAATSRTWTDTFAIAPGECWRAQFSAPWPSLAVTMQ